MKSEEWKIKREKWEVKSEEWRVKSEKLETKSEKWRTKSEELETKKSKKAESTIIGQTSTVIPNAFYFFTLLLFYF